MLCSMMAYLMVNISRDIEDFCANAYRKTFFIRNEGKYFIATFYNGKVIYLKDIEHSTVYTNVIEDSLVFESSQDAENAIVNLGLDENHVAVIIEKL